MKTNSNKEIALGFLRAMVAGDVPRMEELLAEDASVWVVGNSIVSGTKTKREYLQQFDVVGKYITLPIRISFAEVTAEDNRVCVAATSDAELKNGGRYANNYHFLISVRGGRITSVKEYMDTEAASKTFEPMFRPPGADAAETTAGND